MADLLNQLADIWEVVRFPLGAAFCLAGALLCMVGTVGVLRFPDVYTRLHAASITDTSGAGLVLLGMALIAPGWLVIAKVIAIGLFLFLTSPTACHALANAAHTAGVQPVIGRVGQAQDAEGDA
ncbi:MAG TPA: monovalent cation/H(+) antiporter subunit G [Hyphomonas sp.]|nr:monovalent cation/H(+) antiporter subunit G [Hyphomonas sp.]MCA8904481.1 monovalent cation/H(+) antiporter subunit G [Hyphomonas sp.]MCB9962751.1 monovalent cation/H(+) antiporter subunit G [Hyphomonas sp.]MCB9969949.1 monovalent cation/H(+) antiporter subunit G [Hyphomonas sp.]HPE48991.1 monovalent cation/H(+) antiporter subunit G [Hyphomonas sp.]